MISITNLECCGVKEMTGLGRTGPSGAVEDLLEDFFGYDDYDGDSHIEESDPEGAFIMFTQAGTRARYGENLKAYILKHDLGSVVNSETKKNPNSGNPLKVYV